jgi:hypothetical protein
MAVLLPSVDCVETLADSCIQKVFGNARRPEEIAVASSQNLVAHQDMSTAAAVVSASPVIDRARGRKTDGSSGFRLAFSASPVPRPQTGNAGSD